MLDFKEEISKYKPIRTVEDLDQTVRDEVADIMDLLSHVTGMSPGKESTRKGRDEGV